MASCCHQVPVPISFSSCDDPYFLYAALAVNDGQETRIFDGDVAVSPVDLPASGSALDRSRIGLGSVGGCSPSWPPCNAGKVAAPMGSEAYPARKEIQGRLDKICWGRDLPSGDSLGLCTSKFFFKVQRVMPRAKTDSRLHSAFEGPF